MDHGTYIGPIEYLKGETAIIRFPNDWNKLLAQFDSLALGESLTHNWTLYNKSDWKLDVVEKD